MTPLRSTLLPLVRIVRFVAFSALLGAGAVHADDYADITSLLKAGKPADALAKADQRLVTAPRDPQLRFLRGVAQADAGKATDAIASFTQLTQDYPELPEPYNNLAVLYAGQNQLDKARTALEMAIRTNPSYATAHENLGDIYAKLAGQAYSKALQLDSDNGAALKPKLALIRNLFASEAGASRPLQTAAATPTALPASVTKAPAPAPATKAATPLPAPLPAPAPAPTPVAAPKPPPVSPPAVPPAPVTASAAPEPAPSKAPVVSAAADKGDSTAGASKAAVQDVEAAVARWAAAWSARDMKDYLASYGSKFDPPGKQSRAAWEKERTSRIVPRKRIEVKVSDMSVNVQGDKATAKFYQSYDADALSVSSRKTLEMVRQQGRWLIVRESTGG